MRIEYIIIQPKFQANNAAGKFFQKKGVLIYYITPSPIPNKTKKNVKINT